MLTLFLLCSHVSADTIFLRGENKELSATIISWSAEGLRIQSEGKELQELLPWHSIQSITREVSSPSLDEHLQMGKMLFRAKSRLLRGDITLAAPLFEEAFLKLKSSSGKDAYLATEGLLRCKIAKGDIEGAIEPWFCCIVHLKNELPKPFPTLIEVIDSETLLCPNLPPVWSDEAMGNILISLDSNEDAIADFVTVVKRKINTSDTNSLHKGALFLLEVLILMDGEGENYETIYSKKMQHISTMPTWQVVWVRYALAVGLLKQDKDKQQLGLLEFARVASEHGASHPWLAGASMIQIAQSLELSGEIQQAENIRSECIREFPLHPLLLTRGQLRKGK